MEFEEKARLRIAHWMKHNADHVKAYLQFADELENSGYDDAARNIREMAETTNKCTGWLEKALSAMNDAPET